MTSLLPADAVAELEAHLGTKFSGLPPQERLALVTAATEGEVNHGRMRDISTDHPSDITKMLGRLVKDGLLVSEGVGRGMRYLLPWQKSQVKALFSEDADAVGPGTSAVAPELSSEPPQLSGEPPQLSGDLPQLPVYLDWAQLSGYLKLQLELAAHPVRERSRVASSVLQDTVVTLCTGRYLGRRVLAQLLNRNPDDLLKRTLNPMVGQGLLKTAFLTNSDPRQAYTARNTDQASPQ